MPSNRHHFCRVFKEKTGLTVMEYVLRTRIMMAKVKLATTSLSVTEISECCGFSSLSYFSRAFRQETGMAPGKYRKTEGMKE